MLSKGESLTLDEAIDVCRTYEATLSQPDQLNSESEKSINAVKGDNLNRGARGTPANLRNALTVGENTHNHVINVLHMVPNAKAVERPITGLVYAVQSPSLSENHAVDDEKIPERVHGQKLEIDKPGVKHLPQEL